MGPNRQLKIIIASSLISYACVHPLVMVISHAMPSTSDIARHQLKTDVRTVVLESFSIDMLPWSIGFMILGGLVGHFYYRNRQIDEAKTRLLNELQAALKEVKILTGILPICCVCKQIRDDKGYWNQVEQYFSEHTDANFTHSYCPNCLKIVDAEILGKNEPTET